MQAAGLRVLLPHLAPWTERAPQRSPPAYASAGLGDLVTLPAETEGGESCFHLYMVRTADRDALAEALEETGIGARAYYTVPMHKQPALADYAPKKPLPGAEAAADGCLALPMGPALDNEDVTAVVEAVGAALAVKA